MKTFQSLFPIFGLVAAAQATGWNDTIVWTTVTTDIYTTYCPASTTFTMGTKTYTATESQTLTITECPCTYSKPLTTLPSPSSSYVPPTANSSSIQTASTSVPNVYFTTTEIVTALTTYCPAPTTYVNGNQSYTVTSATTLTITNCPCTKATTYPGSVTTVTIGSTTTYCPAPTTITTGGSTYSVTTPGSITVPVCTTSIVPIISGTPVPQTTPVAGSTTLIPAPPATTPLSNGTSITTSKKGPSPTTSGPVQITANAAAVQHIGYGAIAAGLAAFIL